GESLDKRPKRGPANAENRALLAGILFCERCDNSPMYRLTSGRGASAVQVYRCTGREASREGGGNLVKVAALDGIVGMLMRDSSLDVMETTLIPGTDHAAELDEIRFEIRSLATQDLSDDEYDTRLADLRAERDRLASLPSVPDRIERRP